MNALFTSLPSHICIDALALISKMQLQKGNRFEGQLEIDIEQYTHLEFVPGSSVFRVYNLDLRDLGLRLFRVTHPVS